MNEMEQMNGLNAPMPPQEQADVTVDDLEGTLTEGAQQEMNVEDAQETEETVERIREGLAELFEDGWTTAEISAFTQDETVCHAIAQGHSVTRAACAYLKNMIAPVRRHAVPTARTTAAGRLTPDNRIEHMTDEQFDAFSRRAREAMLAGKRVSMD